MLGRQTFAYVHKRLQEIKNVDNNDSKFGGVSILAVGDMFQLPPVKEYKLFNEVCGQTISNFMSYKQSCDKAMISHLS